MPVNEPSRADFLSGWEGYPKNFSSIFAQVDLEAYDKRLKNDTKRLFSSGTTEVKFETVLFRIEEGARKGDELITDVVTDDRVLEDTLIKHLAMDGDHFIFLRLPHSWAPFKNSVGALRKILTAVKAHPYFLDFVHGFGHPEGGLESDLSGDYDSHIEINEDEDETSRSYSEFFYNIRYVAKTGRDSWPWSYRKMGVYHKHYFKNGSSTWIILQPTAAAKRLPTLTLTNRDFAAILPHAFLFQSTSQAWRAYLKHLESEVRKDSQHARLDGSRGLQEHEPNFNLAFTNVQSLQYRCERIGDAITTLRSNVEILQGLRFLHEKIVHQRLTHDIRISYSVEDKFRVCISRFSMYQKWVEDMLDRAKHASDLMKTLLNYKHNQAIAYNTTSMDRMAQASKKERQLILGLTKATKRDSGSMKLIAVITMIYLPGTFVATLFSTGFINASFQTNGPSDHTNLIAQALSYVAVTVGLTVITLYAAYMWNRRVRKDEEIENRVMGTEE